MPLPPVPVELLTPRLTREVIQHLTRPYTSPILVSGWSHKQKLPQPLSSDAAVLYDAVQERITPRVLCGFGDRAAELYSKSEPQEYSDTGYVDEFELWKPGPKTRSKNETAWRGFEKQALLTYFKDSAPRVVGMNLPQMWVWLSTPTNTPADSPYADIRILFDRLCFWNTLHQYLPPPPTDIDLWLVS